MLTAKIPKINFLQSIEDKTSGRDFDPQLTGVLVRERERERARRSKARVSLLSQTTMHTCIIKMSVFAWSFGRVHLKPCIGKKGDGLLVSEIVIVTWLWQGLGMKQGGSVNDELALADLGGARPPLRVQILSF